MLGLYVFCFVRSTGDWIECVLSGEIHMSLDYVCFVW